MVAAQASLWSKGRVDMRVLLTTWAWPSHLYALVPLAWALRTAGDDVVVASEPQLLAEITRTGLPGVAVGNDVDAVGMVRGYLLPSDRYPEPDGPPVAGAGNGNGTAPGGGKGPRAMRMFSAHAEAMVDDLVTLARQWRPDLVLFEPTALAGPVAAAAVGVPAVRVLYGTDLMQRARPLLADLLAPLAQRHGAGEFDPFGVATVDPTPATLQLPITVRRLPMRHTPFNGPGPHRMLPPRRDGRPRVCVTWGHTIAKCDPRRFLASAAVAALAGSGIDLVAAVSAEQRPLLGAVPDDVTVLVDTPLDPVLAGCDLVVSHGGAGTVLTALRHGLPMLLIPQLPDHLGHAGRVLATGAGELLTADDATPERIRAAVGRLLDGGKHRDIAESLRDEIANQPTPSTVADRLRELATACAGR